MDRQRKAAIYKETWMPENPRSLFRFSVRFALKPCAPSLGEEDEGAM